MAIKRVLGRDPRHCQGVSNPHPTHLDTLRMWKPRKTLPMVEGMSALPSCSRTGGDTRQWSWGRGPAWRCGSDGSSETKKRTKSLFGFGSSFFFQCSLTFLVNQSFGICCLLARF